MKKRYIFTLGALVGGAAALFLAPKSGKELQADLLEKVEDLQDKIKDFDQEAFKTTCKEQLEEIKTSITNFDFSESIQIIEEKFKALNERVANLKVVIEEQTYTLQRKVKFYTFFLFFCKFCSNFAG